MMWNFFIGYAVLTMCCWLFAGYFALYKKKERLAGMFACIGLCILGVFIVKLWMALERPPLRTMGETRLWYAFFLAALGIFASYRWKYAWLMTVSCFIAGIFLIVDIVKPELHSKTLMPALQSYWFIPHVTVYIFSYALLGVSCLCSLRLMYQFRHHIEDKELFKFTDNIVYVGLGFLLLGLLFGAFWAKEAWGHYWAWDPKETWAFITVIGYLIYIHMRLQKNTCQIAVYILPFAFILLMITWLGVSYLPTAPMSVHTY